VSLSAAICTVLKALTLFQFHRLVLGEGGKEEKKERRKGDRIREKE
jgi:hypothetical protein